MTDKVQKIKEWIQMRKLCTMDEHMKFYSNAAEAEYNALCNIEHFIDSMQEESEDDWKYSIAEKLGVSKDEFDKMKPVSEPIDFEQELYKAFGQVKDFTLGMQIAKKFYEIGRLSNIQRTIKNWKEPVSEDLEEAVNTYIGYPPEVDECSSVYGKRQAFKAGAKWQKQQDSKLPHIHPRDTIEEYAYQCAYDISNDWAKETPEWRDVQTACMLGAQWQKEKDSILSKDWEELIDALSKRYPEVSFAKLSRIAVMVAKWQKEQMMAKAFPAEIDSSRSDGRCILGGNFARFETGERVKVIVIKEG